MFGFFKRIIGKQISSANLELRKEFEARLKQEIEILRIKATDDLEILKATFQRHAKELCKEILADEMTPEIERAVESKVDEISRKVKRELEDEISGWIEDAVGDKASELERDMEREIDEKCQWSNFEDEAEQFFDRRLVEQIQDEVERELSDKAKDFVVKDDLVFEIKKELNVRANESTTDEMEKIAVVVVAKELPKAIDERLKAERDRLVSAIKIFASMVRNEE